MQTAQMKKGRAHRKDATPTATRNYSWLLRLQELAARHSHLGLCADLTALTLIELGGVYCILSGIEGGDAR